jgi:hypothetical protein
VQGDFANVVLDLDQSTSPQVATCNLACLNTVRDQVDFAQLRAKFEHMARTAQQMSTPPPEGVALEEARASLGLSQNAAAKKAGISGTRWRQIVSGQQPAGGGPIPVHGSASTVARMAAAVELPPERLEAAGRGDAAVELRKLLAVRPALRELEEEVKRLLNALPEKRRERLVRLFQEEEAELERLREARLRRWRDILWSEQT